MNSYLFSIIIPVYNAEKTLLQTVESVVQQTYPNWELILVDDCSQDDSWRIIEEYSLKCSRVIGKKLPVNSGGAKMPCDIGIGVSKGDYCLILGNDDILSNDYLECARHKIEETDADIVLSRCVVKDLLTKKIDMVLPKSNIDTSKTYSGRDACLMTMASWDVCTNGMAFKREIYDYILKENPCSYMNSDELSSRIALIHAKKVGFSNGEYTYWQLASSVTHKNSVKLYEGLYVDAQLIDFAMQYFDTQLAKTMYHKFLSHIISLQKKYYLFRNEYSIGERQKINLMIKENYMNVINKYKAFSESLYFKLYSSSWLGFRAISKIMSLKLNK